MHVEDVAEICHESNRTLQRIINDPNNAVAPPWIECSQEMRNGVIDGVRAVQGGAKPEGLHEKWYETKRAQGWVWGETKSFQYKTHPCLVPFDQLPLHEQAKDHLFYAIANALAEELSC